MQRSRQRHAQRASPVRARARALAHAAVAAAIAFAVAACATSPTGRGQVMLFSSTQMARMGEASFAEIREQQAVLDDPAVTRYVECVADAITSTVAPDESWEVVVFDQESANAFALPGGHIGVHSGLLDVAENQDQLATVVAHEVAHVQASHGNARMSASTLTQVGLTALQAAVASEGGKNRQAVMAMLGVGAQVGILLPYSRSQETEADLLGLDYMARAGFDPRASVDLWQNMGRAGGGQPPEFLSTHPSHGSRIGDLRERMPRALSLYRDARDQGRRPDCR